MSYDQVTDCRQPKSANDPLIEVVESVADAIFDICGPLFWGFLVIAVLSNFFR